MQFLLLHVKVYSSQGTIQRRLWRLSTQMQLKAIPCGYVLMAGRSLTRQSAGSCRIVTSFTVLLSETEINRYANRSIMLLFSDECLANGTGAVGFDDGLSTLDTCRRTLTWILYEARSDVQKR